MRVLGIDPGATTGWCLYHAPTRCVLGAGHFTSHEAPPLDDPHTQFWQGDVAVIERPKGYGPTRPQLVDCGYVAGRLAQRMALAGVVHELTRLDVKQELTEATHGEIRVVSDATAWAALKMLHGPDCDRKGGPLHGVKAHARAALAVAVAFCLRAEAVGAARAEARP